MRFLPLDGRPYRILMGLYQYMSLNVLYLIFCIPVVTIPAATAGLFTVSRKYVYREEPALFVTFWNGVRENFVQSSLVGLLMVLSAFIGLFDFSSMNHLHSFFDVVLVMLSTFASVFVFFTSIHMFSMMVHLKMSFQDLLKHAFMLNFIKPVYSIINGVLVAILILLTYFIPILSVLLFFSVSATISYWCTSRKLNYVITKTSYDG